MRKPPGKPPAPIGERLWKLIDVAGADECWLWTGNTWKGYGQFGVQIAPGVWKKKKAHRVAYELTIGLIPEGLQLDHLCRTPACCNPAHLEPVTNRENGLRGTSPAARHAVATHCRHGHEFTPENTMVTISPEGWPNRECRPCYRRQARMRRDAATGITSHQCATCARYFSTQRGLSVHESKVHGRWALTPAGIDAAGGVAA